MQIIITIPTMRSRLRYWKWGLLGVLTLALLLAWSHGTVPEASANNVSAVSAGYDHTCALTVSGGVKCWGNNHVGQLGSGGACRGDSCSTPVDVTGLTSGVVAVSSGYFHTCAVTTAGGVKCWGWDLSGTLGDGGACGSICSTPVDVTGLTSGVVAVSTGQYLTCALTATGGVKCWGYNYGSVPADVASLTSGVSAVSAGGYHACALTTSGVVKCWGNNGAGQLGDGGACGSDCSTPVDVIGLTSGVADISVGGFYTCAVTTVGGAKCWGSNYASALGDGTFTSRSAPVDVYGLTSGVAAISAASSGAHTCAVTDTGGLACWGENSSGEVGNGNTDYLNVPNGVYGLASGVASVAVGGAHTCAVTTAGGLKCWGRNSSGELGDGTYNTRTVAGDVTSFGPGAKSTPGQIDLTNLGQYALPKTCFQVENGLDFTPLFHVCDNDFQPPPDTSAVCAGDGVCEDENPADGAVVVTVLPGNYVISESKAPPEHSPPLSAQACDASSGSCALTFINTPYTHPWHPWDVNGDGFVRINDILAVVQHYFQDKPLPTPTP